MHTLEQLRTKQLAGVQRLDLSDGLTEFPPEIFDLADSLEILNLSGNALSTLPADLSRLHKLRVLFCSDNQFTVVPEVLGQCPQLSMVGFKANQIHTLPAAALPPALRWLILTDNQLQELPEELGASTNLQKLMLAGNQLRHLPASMQACTKLELLRIADNQFSALPAWLLALPRLSWLAYAGNPFSEPAEAAAVAADTTSTIDWHSLALEQKLGEGASGIIYQAQWQQRGAAPRPVAVKLFKGARTSDGLPGSEMAACLSAGTHPSLIAVEGKISGHPDRTDGLVLQLIAPSFGNLGGPPSLASCTRDVYAVGTSFPLDVVLRIARRMASAAQHLHTRGILHGDLYAHNILTTSDGECLLGDFGAACFFSPEQQEEALLLQRLEVRAFGCLLDDLLTHCAAPATSPTVQALLELQQHCMQPTVAERPLFKEIQERLAELG
ncbi:leucine-rich repeat-containing serine/threonine-protein kinase [Hymenobacter tibetensis]|uniref:Leucine-rich repeat-containing serine/threonine-protein kinase n=1 Tax=Hymenobacter tibetensis TaxID=497967 RepID=A0ABY4CU06_9BACT|nr:leucine-rich repeat-containing protein kinase family protein [Hymenobacter tibetensis]UOG73227.1 leucine-rich repeat-containing serine/threonine-protein kinase [Hymenobacter tibetensis]